MMDKVITIGILVLLTFACKKEKIEECKGVEMTGSRSIFVGKWQWYNTRVEEWYDIGAPTYHDCTPENQGFEYYFTISSCGEFKGYRNDTLINDYLMSKITYEIYDNLKGLNSILNCSEKQLEISKPEYLQSDSIVSPDFPLKFKDVENHLESKRNFFVKVE